MITDVANGAENNSRLQATVYPDGRVVDENYSPEQSPITGITHSGTTATATTASADGLSVGQTITISGASPSAYDGTFTVGTIISSTQFTYVMSSTPASNASGSYVMVAAQSLDNVISRVDGLQDHSTGTVLEGYTYLGLSTVVQESHPQTGINLTYISQSGDLNPPPSYAGTGGDRYTGLDQFGRVVDQYYVNPSTPTSPTDDFQYAYDRDGNPLYKNVVNQGATAAGFSQLYHSNGASEANAYDSLNRLISFSQGTLSASGTNGSVLDTVSTASTTQSWSLDALGNWSSVTTNGTAQTRTFNGQNQLTAVSGLTTPTYDHNGNMTKDQNGITYTYDAWNRMATDVGSGVETLGYLAGGQRASIAASGSTTSYSYFNAAWQEIELDNNTGASGSVVMQDTYVWGQANIDELVARDDASANRLYAQQDANWDVTALVGKVSGTWQVVERFTYTSYGVATVLSASWASTTDAYGWVYRYQAGKYDSVSGLYNFRNRDYSPTLGQWLENDPAGYVQGANLYQANLGAPISHVDPYGLTPTTGGAGDGNNARVNGFVCITGTLTMPPPGAATTPTIDWRSYWPNGVPPEVQKAGEELLKRPELPGEGDGEDNWQEAFNQTLENTEKSADLASGVAEAISGTTKKEFWETFASGLKYAAKGLGAANVAKDVAEAPDGGGEQALAEGVANTLASGGAEVAASGIVFEIGTALGFETGPAAPIVGAVASIIAGKTAQAYEWAVNAAIDNFIQGALATEAEIAQQHGANDIPLQPIDGDPFNAHYGGLEFPDDTGFWLNGAP